MDTFFFLTVFSFCALMVSVASQSCEQSHYDRCKKQLLHFTEKGDLLFASSPDELQQECLQAQSALGCLTRYFKKCLSPDERVKQSEDIAGPQKLTLGLCTDEGDFRSKYIQSLSCLRNMSSGLMYCKEKYDRNQRDIHLVAYEDKTHLQCCSFDGYRRCLRMVIETQDDCREGTGEVVDGIAHRIGGNLSEETCSEHFPRCTGSGSASIQTTTVHFAWIVVMLIPSVLLATKQL